jgi:hypothetical protein
MIFLIVSCDFLDRAETKMIYFDIENTSNNLWEDVVVFAKDQSGITADSSYRTGFLAGNRSVISVEIPKIHHIQNGIFEIQAKSPYGKLIVHEFGSINKPRKEKSYEIKLRDSTIVFL